MAAISLVSVNIERDLHTNLVTQFLKERMPDVVCLQELPEDDVSRYRQLLGGEVVYEPAMREITRDGRSIVHGIGIISHFPIRTKEVLHYAHFFKELQTIEQGRYEMYNNSNCPLICVDIEKEGVIFRVCTTHFSWSQGGLSSDKQRSDMKKLLTLLEREKDFALCGDFNTPRGGEIYAMLSSVYKDNIPGKFAWSLDRELHGAGAAALEASANKAGNPGIMVDGLFTTPGFVASDVELHPGISDHMAITATISRV